MQLEGVCCVRLSTTGANRLQVSLPNTSPALRAAPSWSRVVYVERVGDASLGGLVLTDDTFGVDPEWDLHTVSCPLGYLSEALRLRWRLVPLRGSSHGSQVPLSRRAA